MAELRRTVDTMIVVPNDRLLAVVPKGTSFRDALKKADEILLHATQGISDLVSVTGDVNVDFADVRTVMSSRGPALMGSGFGEGENRAETAAKMAISSPLLDNVSIAGARGVLINITGGLDLAIDEVTAVSSLIQGEAGDDAEIIFGAVHDASLQGKIRVTVIATGFDSGNDEKVIPADFRRTRPQPQPPIPPAQEPVVADIARAEPVRAVGGARSAPVPPKPAPRAVSQVVPQAVPLARFPERSVSRDQISGLDIPTFIRRQMD
jgi:cell division protein FtsZ